MKRLLRCYQFARALVRGARYYIHIGEPKWSNVVGVVRSLLTRHDRRVPSAIRRARLRACRKCELYDAEYKTCGNGGGFLVVDDGRRMVPYGCQCWLPLKTAMPHARCFMEDIGEQSKWPVWGKEEQDVYDALPDALIQVLGYETPGDWGPARLMRKDPCCNDSSISGPSSKT